MYEIQELLFLQSLIALAVMAAAGAASAQSSVQLYGLADIWFGSSETEVNGVGVRQTAVDSSGVNTSRWGVKGSEDLGGGLKANFQLEQGIALDTGAASGFDRQSWVGVSGGFGQVQVGKVWSSYDDVISTNADLFGANVASIYKGWVGYTDRVNNAIKYTSPNFSGFTGSLTYSFGEDKSATASASSVMALGLQYSNGPLNVGFAHQKEEANSSTSAIQAGSAKAIIAAVTNVGSAAQIPSLANGSEAETNLINGSYNFGVAKLVASYNNVKATANGSADSVKANEYNVGVEVPLAANLNLAAGYAQSTLEYKGQDFYKTTAFSAALVYSLSKRTAVYGAIVDVEGENEAGTPLNYNTQTNIYAVGINHKF